MTYAIDTSGTLAGPLVHVAGRGISAIRLLAGGLVLAATLLGVGPQTASAALPVQISPNMIEHAYAMTPRRPMLAHVRFCIVYAGQCDIRFDTRDPTRSIRENIIELQRVNRAVNRAIRPRQDRGQDRWDINVAAGDCEDYALQKRAELLALGWPSHALRMAVVRMPDGIFHAVLLVRAGGTDYVLDNLTSRILPWDQTPYRYIMIQDRLNPRNWHDVAPRERSRLLS